MLEMGQANGFSKMGIFYTTKESMEVLQISV